MALLQDGKVCAELTLARRPWPARDSLAAQLRELAAECGL